MTPRLQELLQELAKDFGKTTRWRVLCKEHNAMAEADQIKLAEQVLAEWSTGTVAEWQTNWLESQGVKSMDLDEFLGQRNPPKSKTKRKKRA